MKKLILAVTCVMWTSGALVAHHSWGGAYDLRQQVILKGTLSKAAFKAPHVLLTIETRDSGTWVAECTNVEGFKRLGISEDTLKVGDYLEIVGSPSRDPDKRVIAAYWEIRRPADGMRWPLQEWTGPRVIE
jgi:hypothetical protein